MQPCEVECHEPSVFDESKRKTTKTVHSYSGDLQEIPLSKVSSRPANGIQKASNDECSGAQSITIGAGPLSWNDDTATENASDPAEPASWTTCSGGPNGNKYYSTWFTFTVTGGPKDIAVSTQGSYNNGAQGDAWKFQVFSGTCGSLTAIGSSPTGGYGDYDAKRIELTSLANGTYYIICDGICSNTGDFTVSVDEMPTNTTLPFYPVSTLPTLSGTITAEGQWGIYSGNNDPEPIASCYASASFYDWYQFTYDPIAHDIIFFDDQQIQQSFVVSLLDGAGLVMHCNDWGQETNASFTWDESAFEGINMHMPNISLDELGLTPGDTYYVGVAYESTVYHNSNAPGDRYVIGIGHSAQNADTWMNDETLTLTTEPTYSWLTGESNRYAGHSRSTDPETSTTGWFIENSLMYKFNSGSATSVNVNLANLTRRDLNGLGNGDAQLAVLGSPTGPVIASQDAITATSYTLAAAGLSTNTDYWILLDGGGATEGTQLTFDISVSTTFVLPIDLGAYQVACNDQEQAVITWITNSEENNDYFTVLKSFNGVDFFELGTVEGAGTTSSAREYSFVDESFESATVIYYRLKQTDFNGTSETFDILAHHSCTSGGITIFPNPSNGQISILASKMTGQYDLRVLDVAGRLLHQQGVNVLPNQRSEQIDLNLLPGGVYLVSLSNDSGMQRWAKITIE